LDRRTFIGTLVGGLVGASAEAGAEGIGTVPRIGVLAVVPRSIIKRGAHRGAGWCNRAQGLS